MVKEPNCSLYSLASNRAQASLCNPSDYFQPLLWSSLYLLLTNLSPFSSLFWEYWEMKSKYLPILVSPFITRYSLHRFHPNWTELNQKETNCTFHEYKLLSDSNLQLIFTDFYHINQLLVNSKRELASKRANEKRYRKCVVIRMNKLGWWQQRTIQLWGLEA